MLKIERLAGVDVEEAVADSLARPRVLYMNLAENATLQEATLVLDRN